MKLYGLLFLMAIGNSRFGLGTLLVNVFSFFFLRIDADMVVRE